MGVPRERFTSHQVRSAQTLSFESHLAMLVALEEAARRDPTNAILLADMYDRIKMMAVAVQYQLVKHKQWDTIHCPHCHQKADWRKEGPVVIWSCTTVTCPWYGAPEKSIVE